VSADHKLVTRTITGLKLTPPVLSAADRKRLAETRKKLEAE
jgi:hypothetical protein